VVAYEMISVTRRTYLAVDCGNCQQLANSFRLELENVTYFVRSLFGKMGVTTTGGRHVKERRHIS